MLRLLASRYFLSLRKRSIIGVLTGISVVGVAVSTAAMVIVFSAFNGLEGLIRGLYASWDADLRVEPRTGKFFDAALLDSAQIARLPGVLAVSLVLEDNALLRYRDGQMVVKVKAVPPTFLKGRPLDSAMVAGKFSLAGQGIPGIVLGYAIQQGLSVSLGNPFDLVQLWYPKVRATVTLDPARAFNKRSLVPTGTFRLEKQYDEKYVFCPLPLAEELMDKRGRRSALEIDLAPGANAGAITRAVEQMAGPGFAVLAYEAQHASLVKVLRLERFFVFLALAVVLLISSFNIFTALSMLAVEKQQDLAVLRAIGAGTGLVRRLFIGLGLLISTTGAAAGAALGLVVCLIQQKTGIVSMGMQTAIVSSYPVEVHGLDLLVAAASVLATSLAVSLPPAYKAARSQGA